MWTQTRHPRVLDGSAHPGSIRDDRLTSIITADAAAELRLKIGEVVAPLKSSQVMILRNQI
jgi:hypothetical protein